MDRTVTAGRGATTVRDERGFSLVESLVAVTILAYGMLAIAAAFSQGLGTLAGSNFDILAREKAAEAIESVYTARDTKTITWAEIKNVQGESGSDGGVFLDGALPLTQAGDDGLVNTEDDGNDLEAIVKPGADGLLGTDDDEVVPLVNFTREIEIRDISLTLRSLRVIITYKVGPETREYVITTYISSYA
ncbi:MAG: prepilin-type N-terminal cleavage/methylation domain-containing protein [Vicinamibacterales bacterium]